MYGFIEGVFSRWFVFIWWFSCLDFSYFGFFIFLEIGFYLFLVKEWKESMVGGEKIYLFLNFLDRK